MHSPAVTHQAGIPGETGVPGGVGVPATFESRPMKCLASLRSLSAGDDLDALVSGHVWAAFQSPHWLKTWLTTIGAQAGIETFWLRVENEAGEPVLAMPLIRHQKNGLRVIAFPDLGVSDYNAPLLAERVLDAPAETSIWDAILAVLPPADMLHFERMPAMIEGRANPFTRHFLALPARFSGWAVTMQDSWDAYFDTLSPKMREKLGKCRRRFGRSAQSSMTLAQTGEDALALLARLEALQQQRIQEKGLDYHLDDPAIAAFYHELARTGVPTGDVVMGVLQAEGAPVAMNFAIRSRGRVTYLRVANAYGPWAPFALGLLVTEHLMHAVHDKGDRVFDFAMGDYDYKKRFGTEPIALIDLQLPLSWRGWLPVLAWQARRRLSRITWLKALKARLTRSSDGPPVAQKPASE